MIYSGVDQHKRASSGIAILIDQKWKSKIESYTYINDRIISVRFKTCRNYLTVIGGYALKKGKKEETEEFYDTLQKEVYKWNKTDYLIVSDLNARVGNNAIAGAVGVFGEQHKNSNGESLIMFATSNDLKITNTFFRKKDINKFTWNARGSRSIIDYVIANNKISKQVQDVHVYRGADIYSDHYLLIAKITIPARWRKIKNPLKSNEEVFKIYLLQDDSVKTLYQNRLNQRLQLIEINENIEKEWENIKYCIEEAAKEALGKKRK